MRRLGGIRIGWGLVLGMGALWSGCGGGLGPGAGGTGAGSGPLGAAGSGAASSGGGDGNGVAGQGIAGLNPGGAETSGGTTSSGGLGACPAGTESCPCYGNDTCNSGLTCVSTVCVNLAGTGGASTGGTATGGASTGGTATGGVATGGSATGGVATGGTNTGGTATGGVASGGRATGGVTTGGAVSTGGGSTGPGCDVDGPCAGQSCPSCTVFTTTSYVSGQLGTGASCYETPAAISGGLCGNFVVPRTLTINGTDMNCVSGGNWTSLPAKVNGGYCFVISAGQTDYAYFSTW